MEIKNQVTPELSVGNISPTVQDVVNKIFDVSKATIIDIECDPSEEHGYEDISLSHVIGSNTNDMCSFSISFTVYSNPDDDRSLNFFIIQNIKNAEICIIITSSEKEGLKILFKSINKCPIAGIEKYLPNIIKSTIAKLK